LVMADNKKETLDIVNYLEERDCEVDLVIDPEEALNSFQEEDYDVAILDLDMPHLHLQDFQPQQRFTNSPVRTIIAVSMDRSCLLCQASECGVSSYAIKPLDKEWLYRQVAEE